MRSRQQEQQRPAPAGSRGHLGAARARLMDMSQLHAPDASAIQLGTLFRRKPVRDGVAVLEQEALTTLLALLFVNADYTISHYRMTLVHLCSHSKTRVFIVQSLLQILLQAGLTHANGQGSDQPSHAESEQPELPMAELQSCDALRPGSNWISLGRQVLRRSELGKLRAHVGPATALRAINMLSFLASSIPTIARTILSDAAMSPRGQSNFWDSLLDVLGVIRSGKSSAKPRELITLLTQLLHFAANPVLTSNAAMLQQYVSLLSEVCKLFPTKATTAQPTATMPSAVAGVPEQAGAQLAPPGAAATLEPAAGQPALVSPIAARSAAATRPASTAATPMKSTKAASEIAIPTLDIISIGNLVAVQTSDLLSAEAAKACSGVLAVLGLVPANARAIATILDSRVNELANAVRSDLSQLCTDALALQNERRASTQGLGVDDEHDAIDAMDAEEDNVFEVDESIRRDESGLAPPESVAEAAAAPAGSASGPASAIRPAIHLPSFALFTRTGSAQKVLLRAVQAVVLLDESFTASGASSAPNTATRAASQSSIPATPGIRSVGGTTSLEAAPAAPPAAAPLFALNLSALWTDLNACLVALSKLNRNTSAANVLHETIETFLHCHRNVKAPLRSKPVLVHQNSLTEPSTPSNILDDSEQSDAAQSAALLFSKFIDTHQRLINDLVRKSPALLLSQPFSVILQFPHVLEFRVKEEYFRQNFKRQHQQQRYQRVSLHLHRFAWRAAIGIELTQFLAETTSFKMHLCGSRG